MTDKIWISKKLLLFESHIQVQKITKIMCTLVWVLFLVLFSVVAFAAQLCAGKCLVDVGSEENGQADDNKATVAQITSSYTQGIRSSISERATHPFCRYSVVPARCTSFFSSFSTAVLYLFSRNHNKKRVQGIQVRNRKTNTLSFKNKKTWPNKKSSKFPFAYLF